MNTGEKNTKGRTIYQGPRGGRYVLGPGGRKIRTFTVGPAAAPAPVPAPVAAPPNRNTQGRIIHRGPRGGEYVLGPGGQKIRKFTRATAAPAAASTLNAAKAHMNTLKTAKNRKAYLRSRAANMTNANWRELNRYKIKLNFEKGILAKLSKMIKLGNNEYIDKHGYLYDSHAYRKTGVSFRAYNDARKTAFGMNPKFLNKNVIPYVSTGNNNQAFKNKLVLKYSNLAYTHGTHAHGTHMSKKIYFNSRGDLYYISLNGRKHKVDYPMTQLPFMISDPKAVRRFKRLIGQMHLNYPRSAIPPVTPEWRRNSPVLLNNIMGQIYNGGRGSNINAGRYTAAERNVLIRRLSQSIGYFKQQREAKKAEAAQHRETLRTTNWFTDAEKKWHRNKAAAANERVGYFDDAVRAYTRGLRALKPLSKNVPASARRMAATPNRASPAPASEEFDAIYMPLEKPHLVVKTPGVGTIYLNPNSFRGLVKNAARVNIPEADVRDWLRMARRNFANEPLFRHPIATSKNVTASHIRFSRA